MKTAFCYYRKSIENESEKSIARQREAVRKYAEDNNIKIIGEFEDIASSENLNRPGFKEMFYECVPAENPDYILVNYFDRITREMDDLGLILAQLKKYMGVKTRLHSTTEENDYDDDHYKLFIIMMKTFGSTEERVRIVNRMKSGRENKQKKGGFIGGTPPVGYYSITGTGKLYVKEEEVSIVKMVFELRDQKYTMQKIADALNVAGFTTRKGQTFKPMTVQRIIKHRELYEGKKEATAII